MVSAQSIVSGLVAVLLLYEILVNGYAALMPAATAITVVGINFAFVIIIAVLIVVFSALAKLSGKGNWK